MTVLTAKAYGTKLMQHCIRTRVLGYHSPSAQTRLSLSFNGLELGLKLELERKFERAVQKTKNYDGHLFLYIISTQQFARDETNGSITSSACRRRNDCQLLQNVLMTQTLGH